MKPTRSFTCLLASVLAVSSAAARADQLLSFRVPVTLNEIYSDVDRFSVGCRLTTADNPVVNLFNDSTTVALQKNYKGTVTVNLSVPESKMAQANYWVCQLWLRSKSEAKGCEPSHDAVLQACKAKEGSVLVKQVEGPLSP